MKTILITILSLFFTLTLLSANTANVEQNTATPTTTDSVKQFVSTNLNEVIIDILRGAKNLAGSEVYSASKVAITKSVDFTIEQTPMVVKEFLRWKLAEGIINLLLYSVIPIFVFYISYHCKKYSERKDLSAYEEENFIIGKWVSKGAGIILSIVVLGVNGMPITKIVVAPRVYLIEYVVDNIKH